MFKRISTTLAVALVATALLSPVHAEQSTTAGQSETSGTTDSNETGTTQKQTLDESNTKGKRLSKDWQKGVRNSTRKEVAEALEKSRNSSLSQEMSLPPLFYGPLTRNNSSYTMNIGDLLLYPVESNGIIYSTRQEGLQKLAQARGIADDYIKKDQVLANMQLLAKTGIWMRQQVGGGIKLASRWGYEDWEDLAERVVNVKAGEIAAVRVPYNTAGQCRMVGDYTRIQCGECILDVSNNAGLPELVCSGKKVFGGDAAGGLSMKVAITDGFSLRDTETKASSDESFKAFTDAVNEYVDDAVRKGQGVEATEVKKIAYSLATQKSKKLDVIVKGLTHQDDAGKLLGMVGFK